MLMHMTAVAWVSVWLLPGWEKLPTHSALLHPRGCLGWATWLLVITVPTCTGVRKKSSI